MCALTEVHYNVFVVVDQVRQYLVRDFLDGGAVLLFYQPLEDLVLVQKIALVYRRDLVLEVHQCRQMIDTVFLGLGVVVYAHDDDTLLLQLVVDVLQLVQDPDVLLVVLVVCGKKSICWSFTYVQHAYI